MTDQNYKNHGRYIPLWHFITPIILFVILGMSVINLVHTDMHAHDLHIWLPIILIPVAMLVLWWYARSFALKAQDRAIRAEENFRHYLLTGKPLPKELRMSQIIALRFASDEEFPALSQKAVNEKLSQKQIKQAVKNWRADYNRV
jgi:hypothetical protein